MPVSGLAVCKQEGGLGEILGPAVSLKSAPAQLPGADAAVSGLFSVKQPGLLAFKRALHALHHPERIPKPFLADCTCLLIRPI